MVTACGGQALVLVIYSPEKGIAMSSKRVRYHNWIAESGRTPAERHLAAVPLDPNEPDSAFGQGLAELKKAVQKAMNSLGEQEKYLILRHYFFGQTISRMAVSSGRPEYKLRAMQRRSLRKLKRELAPFVRSRFGIEVQREQDCPICSSDWREEIDVILLKRDKKRCLSPVIEEIKTRFHIVIKTPQVIISHEKYH